MIYIFNFIQQMFELQKTESIRKLIIKPERRGGCYSYQNNFTPRQESGHKKNLCCRRHHNVDVLKKAYECT